MAPQLFKGPMSLTLAEQQFMQDEESRVKMTDEQLDKFNTWANDREPDVSDAKFWIEKNTNLDFNAFSFKYLNLLIKRAVWISHKTASKALKTSVVKRPGFGLPLGHMPGVEERFPVLFMGGNDEWTAVTLLVRECCMLRVINELSDKPEWWLKVKNNDITAKWKREALEIDWESYIKYADFTTAMADACISELRKKAYIFEKTGIVPVYDYSAAVIKSDNILTPELLASLQNAVKPLENVPSEQQDWHPRSNEQVLNLVHPSLWPLMYGRTRVLQDRVIGVEDALDYCGMGSKLRSPAKAETTQDTFRQWSSRERLKVLSNEFQWLPCDVNLDPATGRAKIASYINNLHPKEHAHLYPIIEQFIEKSLPSWDAIYRWEREFAVQRLTTDDVRRNHCPCPEICGQRRCQPHLRPLSEGDAPRHIRDLERTKRDKAWFAETHGMKLPDADPEAKDYVRIGASDIKSNGFFNNKKRIQVIVKLANIHLTPEKPSYNGGSWHTEGLLNEHIISTALYYYDSENITDCTLDFRTLADREDLSSELSYDQYDWAGIKQAFAIDPRGNTIQNIGSVLTKMGRAIFFPNLLQHHVSPFKLIDPTKPGHRKILALFLVDPAIPIISTSNVPPQQKHWWPSQKNRDIEAGKGSSEIPNAQKTTDDGLNASENEPAKEDLVMSEEAWLKARDDWEKASSKDEWPIGLKKAKEFRLDLMDERKWLKAKEESWLNVEWNFCEH